MSHQSQKQTQLERIILFTDAVFAIAITLLAIEIKIPAVHEVNEQSVTNAFLSLTPRFIGFIISFFVIGVYWIAHHKVFAFAIDYDRKLLWLNMFLLMFIVLLPFSTGFYSEYSFLKLPFLVYSLNILTIGIFQSRLINHLSKPALSQGINVWLRRYISYRGLVPGLFFLSIGIVQYFVPVQYVPLTRFFMMFTAVPFIILRRYFAKKGVDTKNY